MLNSQFWRNRLDEVRADAIEHGVAEFMIDDVGREASVNALGATIELSAGRDEDPSGHSTEMLAGLSAGWMPNDDLQLDVGANVGLNEEAADVQLYVGIAKRF